MATCQEKKHWRKRMKYGKVESLSSNNLPQKLSFWPTPPTTRIFHFIWKVVKTFSINNNSSWWSKKMRMNIRTSKRTSTIITTGIFSILLARSQYNLQSNSPVAKLGDINPSKGKLNWFKFSLGSKFFYGWIFSWIYLFYGLNLSLEFE